MLLIFVSFLLTFIGYGVKIAAVTEYQRWLLTFVAFLFLLTFLPAESFVVVVSADRVIDGHWEHLASVFKW